VGRVGANIAEGYGRSGALDRARFFEYALGSARESQHWYFSVEEVLGTELTAHRIAQLVEIRRLLLSMIRAARKDNIRSSNA
jgi:four helix bundle protein